MTEVRREMRIKGYTVPATGVWERAQIRRQYRWLRESGAGRMMARSTIASVLFIGTSCGVALAYKRGAA